MSKIYIGISSFVLVASISGIPSFTARATDWGWKWLISFGVLMVVLIALGILLDDALQEQLGLSRISYLAILISSVAAVIIGGLIQWL